MKKLTLSAEDHVIDAAKQYAAEQGTSVSALFSRFVLALTAARPAAKRSLPRKSLTRKATGLISLPKGPSDDELLEDAIAATHRVDR